MAKSATNWAERFARPASAGVPDAIQDQEGRQSPVREPVEPAPVLPKRAPAKRPATYRLPDDVLDLIDLAVAAAAMKGERLTKEEAVAIAIRKTFGRIKLPK